MPTSESKPLLRKGLGLLWREKSKAHQGRFPEGSFWPQDFLCAVSQHQLRITLPSRSYQKMKAVPGRALFASSRQTIGNHLLGDLFTSFRVPMSWSHCRLCPRGQGEERNKGSRWLERGRSQTPTKQSGACGSQVAPCFKLCAEIAIWGKGKGRRNTLLF